MYVPNAVCIRPPCKRYTSVRNAVGIHIDVYQRVRVYAERLLRRTTGPDEREEEERRGGRRKTSWVLREDRRDGLECTYVHRALRNEKRRPNAWTEVSQHGRSPCIYNSECLFRVLQEIEVLRMHEEMSMCCSVALSLASLSRPLPGLCRGIHKTDLGRYTGTAYYKENE